MKRYGYIVCLLLMAVAWACSPFPRESERMADAMRQAEAVYGDGNLLVEADTALFIPSLAEASEYYAGKKQYAKAALAALYNGYTERDFDKEAAMVSFKEAERYGELAHDSLTMARAEYHMGKMLFNENRNEEALLLFKKSRSFVGKHCVDIAPIENILATVYILSKQLDSAETCLHNSLVHAQNCSMEQMEWKIINNYSVLYRILGEYERSLNCQRAALEKPWLDDTKKVFVYLNLGNAFMAMAEMDSAAFYYRRLEAVLQVAEVKDETKVSAYGALLKFAKRQGNDALALQYLEQQTDALYELMRQQREQNVYRIQKQYDYEALQNTMNQKIIRRHRIILLSSVLLLILAVVIVILQFRHKKLLTEEAEMKQQLDSLKERLSQAGQSTVLDGLVVSQLKTILLANRTMNKTKDPQYEWRPLLMEVMCGKEKPFEAAQATIEKAYPNLYSVILEAQPGLSETEAKVCLLSCFDISNSEIAELLELRTNTVNQSRTTVRKKLDLKPEKMSEQLQKLFSK